MLCHLFDDRWSPCQQIQFPSSIIDNIIPQRSILVTDSHPAVRRRGVEIENVVCYSMALWCSGFRRPASFV